MYIGSFCGCRLRINFFFFLFLFIYAILGMLPEVVFLFIIVFLHELAHSLVARSYGISVSEIELYPFGGVARMEGLLELEPEVERRIAWAGPLLNFLLVGLALVVYNNNYYFGPLTENNLLFFIQANLMLAFFNLFPALPLDGGRILRAMLTQRYGFRRATEIATFMAKVLAIFIFASGILLFLQGEFNLTIFIAAGFLYIASTHEQGMAIYAFLHSLSAKELEMERRGGMRGEQLVVHEEAQVNDVLRLFAPKRYHFVRVVDHSRQVLGEISETKLLEAALKKGIHFPVKKIL